MKQNHSSSIFELFFVKKYLLVGAWAMLWAGGSVVQWFSGSVDQWISERCLYVTPIRLDLFDLQSPQLVQHSCSARMI